MTNKFRKWSQRFSIFPLARSRSNESPVFGTALIDLPRRNQSNVPDFVKKCIECIENHHVKTNIYGKAGQHSKIQSLKSEVGKGNLDALSKVSDIHTLTGVFKLFFRELPEPVISGNIANELLNALSSDDEGLKIFQISNILMQMNLTHQETLIFLIQHLKKVIKNDEKISNSKNLAIIFAPNLMMKPPEDLQLTMHLRKQQRILQSLLQHADLFVPQRGSLTNPLPRRRTSRPVSQLHWED